MWAENAVFYQIHPLGLCGVPRQNDGQLSHRILALRDWAAHVERLGANAVCLLPVYESDGDGSDVRDFRKVDGRLGTNDDLRAVVEAFHARGIKVVLYAMFNCVGRNFWAFRDLREKRRDSPYKDWFYSLDFDGNTSYDDGLWYETWEYGDERLVRLDPSNPAYADELFDIVRFWIETFDIDGLFLGAAYRFTLDFLRRLHTFTDKLKPDFFLIGETPHGEYDHWVDSGLLHTCTNYESSLRLLSSLNGTNLFAIIHALNRQCGPNLSAPYRGMRLLSFVDKQDMSRVASVLMHREHLPLAYALLFGMPGIPCLYYGSEWGEKAYQNRANDWNLCPAFDAPQWNELTDYIAQLARVRRESPALCGGDFADVLTTFRQAIFQRRLDGERVLVAINADSEPYRAHCDYACGRATDMFTGRDVDFGGGLELPPYSAMFLRCER